MHNITVKSILSAKNGMNLYRGCTHGCIYCDVRSTCYQVNVGRPFEDIEVKINAPELLEQALRSKRKKCMIGTGGMSDPYLHAERELSLTRRCLEIIEHYGFGLAIQTKSDLILRDLDLLKKINEQTKCVVQITMTTCDEELCRLVEPHVCTTRRRAEVLEILRDEGIPTVCWMTPILPYINDTEENIRGILALCKRAECYGVLQFGIGLTLRDGDRQYYYRKLDEHFPGIRSRYEKNYGNAYELPVPQAGKLLGIVKEECKSSGMEYDAGRIFTYLNQFEEKGSGEQLTLSF